MITRISSSAFQAGPQVDHLRQQITLALCNHVRVVMAALVMSLLLAVIAVPALTVQGENLNFFGAWVAKYISPGSPAPNSNSANSFTPIPPFIGAPTNLQVTGTSSGSISLSWTGPAGNVHHYEVERSDNNSEPFVLHANAGNTTFIDSNVTSGSSYLYRVRAVEQVNSCALVPSGPSNMAMGTAMSFQSTALGQSIRAQHFHAIRTAINAVRAAANIVPATWLRNDLTNLQIKATDVQELRDRLGEALNQLNIPVGTYIDPVLTVNSTLIKSAHLQELQTKSTRGQSSGSGRPALLSDRAKLGVFDPVVRTLPLTPVHMSVLPDGRVLFWGRDRFRNPDGTIREETAKSEAWVWDVPTDEKVRVANTTTNMFCSGHSFLPDGRLLVSGGHRDPVWDGDGEPHINIFDFRNNGWVRTAQDMNKGRWYPYNVMIGSGKTLIVSGSYFITPNVPSSHDVNIKPQYYNPGNGCVEDLNDAPSGFFTAYPFLHARPDGQVLQIQSPAPQIQSPVPFEPDKRSRLFNPANPPAANQPWPSFADTNDDHGLGSSVLFDSGRKVLVMGGFTPTGKPNNNAEYTKLHTGATWTQVAPMNFKRAYHTATILPDGKVLVTGGVSCPGGNNVDCVDRAAMNAEMWNAPAFDENQPTTSVRWRTMARHSEVRAYHSVAVLLPDGRVLVGGGGRPGAVGEYYPNTQFCPVINNTRDPDAKLFGHSNVEIYSPPYLFDANGNPAERPAITSAPTSISYGQTYFLGTFGATGDVKVSLVRLASVTHGFNQDQRQMFLGEQPDPPLQVFSFGINIKLPNDPNRFPPGYYMLFVLNNGVPSMAKIVSVGSTSIFLKEAPATNAFGQGQTWEQGIEFSTSVNGQITHIRFWKEAGEPGGGHIGRIWTTSGTLLATATFSCETASGWQQAPLSTPLQITAGTRYKVTYNVHNIVAKTFNALSGPITSGPFTAWGSSFSTPAGSFPTTGSTSNLFADVVFNPTP